MADVLPTRDERDLLPTDLDLDRLQWTSILYYLHETNPDNGLVRDKTDPAAPCSVAAMGMALATLPVVIERGVFFRPFAAKLAPPGRHGARRVLPAVRGQVGPPEAPVPVRAPPGAGTGRLRVQGLLLPLP